MSMIAELRQGWGAITGRSAPGPGRLWLMEHGRGPRAFVPKSLVWGLVAPSAVVAAAAAVAAATWWT